MILTLHICPFYSEFSCVERLVFFFSKWFLILLDQKLTRFDDVKDWSPSIKFSLLVQVKDWWWHQLDQMYLQFSHEIHNSGNTWVKTIDELKYLLRLCTPDVSDGLSRMRDGWGLSLFRVRARWILKSSSSDHLTPETRHMAFNNHTNGDDKN